MRHKLILISLTILYFIIFLSSIFMVASLSLYAIPENITSYDIMINKHYLKSYDRMCNVLSLSGGGSFGAVEVGILKNIYLPEYDIITGVSAGALNSALLSYYNSKYNSSIVKGINTLIDLYSSLKNEDVYIYDKFDFAKYWSYYSTKPLRKTLTNILSKHDYVYDAKDKITLIGTTNLNLGYLEVLY